TPALRLGGLISLLLVAYLCQHYLTPSRVSWHMSLVDDNRRGAFTAKKEIISLIGGMIFSQTAGILLDFFKARGDMRTCFVIFLVTITVLAVLHLVIMLLTEEPIPEKKPTVKGFREILGTVFGSADLRRVILFDSLFAVSSISLHYYSVYLTNTWQASYTYITAVAVVHACFRAVVSPFLGRLADQRSWAYMLRICMLVMAAGYVVFAVATPQTGLYLYPLFSLCYAFSLGGSNAGRTNLCLDYVSSEDRRYILGIQSSISGVVSFLVTIPVSFFVEWLEARGNTLFGMTVYPQQILFTISAGMLLLLALAFLPRLGRPTRVLKHPSHT
ncbi:MAG: MFS transporter, partial [Clostridia bacterium]|nr:MFS transporter [Clostridia bacterium]